MQLEIVISLRSNNAIHLSRLPVERVLSYIFNYFDDIRRRARRKTISYDEYQCPT